MNKENIIVENNNEKKENKNQQHPMYVYALGGLGEVGKNMYVVEQGNEIWIMDSGIKFSSEVSIEGIIPSFEWLKKNSNRIKGLIITHGHEDHIGSVPHLLNAVKIPKIYAGRIAANLIWNKVHERGLPRPKIEIINNKSNIKTLNFNINFFNVNHSIPDCFGVSFESKHGVVVNTADFKFDLSPVGVRADLFKMSLLGQKGVTLMLSDSTNALSDKFALSESVVSRNIDEIVENVKGRVIVATFASNVYRVRELIKVALKHKRKIAVFGYSMDKIVNISRKIKYINVPDDFIISGKEIKNIDDDKLMILSTGTQGEPTAALSKMATGKHKEIKLKKGDTVIFASSAIPGNFHPVEKVTNLLIKKGCTVINNKNHYGVHASGHGGKQEQLLMFNLIRPEYFFPVHGETVMQIKHAKTAVEAGVNAKKIFILKNGDRLKVVNGIVSEDGAVPAKNIYVDDTNLTGQSSKVISDRNTMSENGIVITNVVINSKTNSIVIKPEINTFGIFNDIANKEVLEFASESVKNDLENYYKNTSKITFSGLKETIRYSTEKTFFNKKGINPIVIPIILNISENSNSSKEEK